ncbi:MAG TPA: flagellar biosynthetic protein FliO [Gammaproteobacteria bacterium]|nr:flagellar biosynthetic protein FliO [Gammaproteobacteria bacterium]
MVVQVMLNLLLVLTLACAFLYVAKRFKQGRPQGLSSIKTVAMLSLGSKEKILLIEVLGQKVLVGVTPSQISTLKTFTDTLSEDSLESFNDVYQKKSMVLGEPV